MTKTLLLLSLCVTLAAPVCHAHASLTRAEPPARSALGLAPSQLRLTFNEAVEAKYSTVELRGPGGPVKGSGPLSTPDPSTLELPLPALPVSGAVVLLHRLICGFTLRCLTRAGGGRRRRRGRRWQRG